MKKYLLFFFIIRFFAFSAECSFCEKTKDECEDYKVFNLRDLVAIAVDKNPMLRAAFEGIFISTKSIAIAESYYYPQVDFRGAWRRWKTHVFLPEGVVPPGTPSVIGPVTEWTFNVRAYYTIWDNEGRYENLLNEISRKLIAIDETNQAQQEVFLEVSRAYFTLLADFENEWYAQKNLVNTKKILSRAKDRKEAGAVPLIDVLKAEVEVANAELALIRAQNSIRISQGNLNIAMGLPPGACYQIEKRFYDLIDCGCIDVFAAMNQALQHRPEVHSAYERIQIAQNEIQKAKSARGPRVFAEGFYGRRDEKFFPRDEDWSIGVNVEVPLFTGFRLTNRVYQAQGEKRREMANYDTLALDVQQQVWNAYIRILESTAFIKSLQSQIRSAKENLRVAEERYAEGAGPIQDFLDAQVALFESESREVEANWELRIAQAEFLRAIGTNICEIPVL